MTPPSAAQWLEGSARFVVANTPNTAPTALVNENWKKPLVSFRGAVKMVGVGSGTLMFTMLLVLGMPLTNSVASA